MATSLAVKCGGLSIRAFSAPDVASSSSSSTPLPQFLLPARFLRGAARLGGNSNGQALAQGAHTQQRGRGLRVQAKTGGGMFDNDEPSILGDRQPEGLPLLERDPDSPHGYLKFPPGYLLELSTLPIYAREDVRRCCCLVAGGVYEQLLFYPVIDQLRKRYPGVQIDVIATARAKQAYEMNPYVRRTFVFDWEDKQMPPAEFADLIGKIKDGYYELLLSTRQAGLGHAVLMWMCGTRQRMAYTIPDVNGVGARKFLTTPLESSSTNQAELGLNMYKEMLEALERKAESTPRVNLFISEALREVASYKQGKAGVQKGGYILVHGVESRSQGGNLSAASMLSQGDSDAVLPLEKFAQITKGAKLPVLYVVPQEKDVARVKKLLGSSAAVLPITTPGQLAVLIDESAGVVCTNTAAVQLATALDKPCVALFGSVDKAVKFAPGGGNGQFKVVASLTESLQGLDVAAAASAVESFTEAQEEEAEVPEREQAYAMA